MLIILTMSLLSQLLSQINHMLKTVNLTFLDNLSIQISDYSFENIVATNQDNHDLEQVSEIISIKAS